MDSMDKMMKNLRDAIETNIEKMLEMAGVKYKNVNETDKVMKEKGLRIDIFNNKRDEETFYILRDNEKDYYAFKVIIALDGISVSDIVEV